ncbi:MAG: fibronectin type III domain-containing protein [Acidimicrobiia bacterium]
MGTSSSRSRLSGLRAWSCGAVLVGAALSGGSAGAASATVPGAPTITSVTAVGLNSLVVAFKGPASNGGARIASYRAVCTSRDGGLSGAHNATHSPVGVRSLTASKTYTCTATATNAVGTGPASATSSPVVVRPSAPAAPTITSVKAVELRSVLVAFTKPADDGGAPITNYRATCSSTSGGATRSQEEAASPIIVGGLTAAETYRCIVAADNRVGLGQPSLPSSAVVARPTAPGAPTITSVKALGLRSISVAFTAPDNNGGASITHYLVDCTSRNGGVSRDRDAPQSPIRVAGLTAGKTYTCTVAASNDVRLGPASPPSKPVVPRAP